MKAAPREVSEVSRLSEEERLAALRAVLRRPLLIAERAEHREDFAKVRRHAEPLRAWFARHTGWTLDVDAECARLYKVPARLDDATHPAFLPKDELPFTRRRYVLLCLALAVLVKNESQTTLGDLARAIVELWKENAAFATLAFDLDATDSRRDLIAAVRLLAEYHAITQVDGDEQRFLHHREQEVLYDVHHHIIFRLLAARRAPSAITDREWSARLEALVSLSLGEKATRLLGLSVSVKRRAPASVVEPATRKRYGIPHAFACSCTYRFCHAVARLGSAGVG